MSSTSARLLVVDDEPAQVTALVRTQGRDGCVRLKRTSRRVWSSIASFILPFPAGADPLPARPRFY